MTSKRDPLSSQALEALARIVGERYTGTEITALFKRSGAPFIVHDGSTKWRFVLDAFEQLQSQAGNDATPVLRVVKEMCQPIGYVNDPEHYAQLLGKVNIILAFSGLKALEDGRLVPTDTRARTLSEVNSEDERAFAARKFHPQVVAHGQYVFTRGAYFHAVFECCKAFDSAVRSNSGLPSSGRALMTQALSENGPIKFNSQQTMSQKDEQQGLMHLGVGLMAAVRNPQAHEPEKAWPISRDDALDLLGLISFLFRKLEQAVVLPPGANVAIQVRL